MARINLLPWRDELRKERQKNFLIILGAAVSFTAIVMAGVHYFYVDRIDYQERRNAYLNKEIKKLDEQIREIRTLEATKKKLQAQLDIIQRLQSSRPEIVHLFDELVKTLPEGVYLKSVTQRGNLINIIGTAQSNARVSSYMWNIEKSEWLTSPKLQVISTGSDNRQRVSNFTLTMLQTSKQEPPAESNKKTNKKKGGKR